MYSWIYLADLQFFCPILCCVVERFNLLSSCFQSHRLWIAPSSEKPEATQVKDSSQYCLTKHLSDLKKKKKKHITVHIFMQNYAHFYKFIFHKNNQRALIRTQCLLLCSHFLYTKLQNWPTCVAGADASAGDWFAACRASSWLTVVYSLSFSTADEHSCRASALLRPSNCILTMRPSPCRKPHAH